MYKCIMVYSHSRILHSLDTARGVCVNLTNITMNERNQMPPQKYTLHESINLELKNRQNWVIQIFVILVEVIIPQSIYIFVKSNQIV